MLAVFLLLYDWGGNPLSFPASLTYRIVERDFPFDLAPGTNPPYATTGPRRGSGKEIFDADAYLWQAWDFRDRSQLVHICTHYEEKGLELYRSEFVRESEGYSRTQVQCQFNVDRQLGVGTLKVEWVEFVDGDEIGYVTLKMWPRW